MRGDSTMRMVEWTAFVVVVGLVLSMQIELFHSAGAFWRDEVTTVLLARQPSWETMLGALATDSFPALLSSLLRVWMASGLGATDAGVRLFGLVVAMALVPALVVQARLMGMRPPVLALALVACNPTFFYWGASIRAYGLAAVLVIILFGLMFRLAEAPTWRTAALAAVAAVATAQSNYQATYVIFAIAVASCILCVLRGAGRGALLCLAVGAVAALSLLPYLPVIARITDWSVIVQMPVTAEWIAGRIRQALGASGATVGWLWLALLAAAMVWPLYRLAWRAVRGRPDDALRVHLYGALVIAIAAPALFIAMKLIGVPTQAWYYIPFMAVVAVAVEASVWGRGDGLWMRIARVVLAALIVAISLPALQQAAHLRRTNVDLVAERLQTNASEADLILVSPFWYGVSFRYYYRGRAPWVGLPAITPEAAGNPYPVIRDLMATADPMRPTLARARATLERGGRIWFVGVLGFSPAGTTSSLGPAPHPKYGWNNVAYANSWAMQAGDFLRAHALHATRVQIPSTQPVSIFEDVPLLVVSDVRR